MEKLVKEEDIIEFLIMNSESIKKDIEKDINNYIGPLDYFYKRQRKDYFKMRVKEILVFHFPEKLEEIHLTITNKCINIVFGGINEQD